MKKRRSGTHERPRRLGRSIDYRLGHDQVRLLDKVSSGGRRPNFFRAAISLLNAYVLWRTRCARDERFVTRTAHLVAAKDRLLANYRKWEGPDPVPSDPI